MNTLAPGIYWMPPDHRTDRPVLAAITGSRLTLMVDAGASGRHARAFLDKLTEISVPPIGYVVFSHSHWDHVFGAAAFDATIISTEQTQAAIAIMATWSWDDGALDQRVEDGLEIAFCRDMIKAELTAEERAQLTLPVPELTFDSELTIDLGGRSVRIINVGGDHAPDSCIIVVPGVVAFLSDCIYHNLHTEPNYRTRCRLFPLLDRLLALDVDWYVLGHDDAPMSREAFEAHAHMLMTIGTLVEQHRSDDASIKNALPDPPPDETPSTLMEYATLFQAGLPYDD